jgi:hypothetical protein
MHRSIQTLVMALLVALAAFSTSRNARATCGHTVPNGARLDIQTGIVTANGAAVDTSACTSVPEFGPSGGYYAQFTAGSTRGSTLTDDFGGFFTVPEYPGGSFGSTENQDTGPEFWGYWTGLTAVGNGWPGGQVLLQPVLSWSCADIPCSNHSYTIGIELVDNIAYYSPSEFSVSPGEVIESYIYQTDGPPNPSAWLAVIETSSQTVSFGVENIPSTFAEFSEAWIVFEGWGNGSANGNSGQLPECLDLPFTDILGYDVYTFDTPSPNWNSYKPYTGPNLWTGAALAPGQTTGITPAGPNCSWGTSVQTPWEYFTFEP